MSIIDETLIERCEDDVCFTAGVIIDKLDSEMLNKFIKIMKKYFVKKLKTKHFSYAEVNTFLFFNSTFPYKFVNTAEKRKRVEEKVVSIIGSYAEMEFNKFSKKIRKNIQIQDITKIITQLINSSQAFDKDKLLEILESKSESIRDRTIKQVSNVVNNTYIIVWDFYGEEEDIIVTPDIVLVRPIKTTKLPLKAILDKFTPIQFALHWLINLTFIIDSAEYAIDSLKMFLSNKKNLEEMTKSMNDKLWKTLRVVFGLLSSTQQILLDLLKQMRKIKSLSLECKIKAEELDFPELLSYIEHINIVSAANEFLEKIENLQKQVKSADKTLLEFINRFRDLKTFMIDDVTTTVNVFSYVLSEIKILDFFATRFNDISSYQAIPQHIAEEEMKELDIDDSIILKGVSIFKNYQLYGSTVYALRGLDFEIKSGEMVAVVGPSGSGKTTLLNILAGLDTADRGASFIFSKNMQKMSDNMISMIRRERIGFIFQYYNLIPQLTVLENVMLPGIMVKRPKTEVEKEALELLKLVGLENFVSQFPVKLSGGQMQRVTIARAMINSPALLFADEPTGDLDSQTGRIVVELIKRFAHERSMAVIFVTHDTEMSKLCDRTIEIEDGKIVNMAKN